MTHARGITHKRQSATRGSQRCAQHVTLAGTDCVDAPALEGGRDAAKTLKVEAVEAEGAGLLLLMLALLLLLQLLLMLVPLLLPLLLGLLLVELPPPPLLVRVGP